MNSRYLPYPTLRGTPKGYLSSPGEEFGEAISKPLQLEYLKTGGSKGFYCFHGTLVVENDHYPTDELMSDE